MGQLFFRGIFLSRGRGKALMFGFLLQALVLLGRDGDVGSGGGAGRATFGGRGVRFAGRLGGVEGLSGAGVARLGVGFIGHTFIFTSDTITDLIVDANRRTGKSSVFIR
jgi:hypothetical protein